MMSSSPGQRMNTRSYDVSVRAGDHELGGGGLVVDSCQNLATARDVVPRICPHGQHKAVASLAMLRDSRQGLARMGRPVRRDIMCRRLATSDGREKRRGSKHNSAHAGASK